MTLCRRAIRHSSCRSSSNPPHSRRTNRPSVPPPNRSTGTTVTGVSRLPQHANAVPEANGFGFPPRTPGTTVPCAKSSPQNAGTPSANFLLRGHFSVALIRPARRRLIFAEAPPADNAKPYPGPSTGAAGGTDNGSFSPGEPKSPTCQADWNTDRHGGGRPRAKDQARQKLGPEPKPSRSKTGDAGASSRVPGGSGLAADRRRA